jgi:hypothetical protein
VPRIDTSVSVDAIIVIVSVLIVENMISVDRTAVLLMTGEVTLVAVLTETRTVVEGTKSVIVCKGLFTKYQFQLIWESSRTAVTQLT